MGRTKQMYDSLCEETKEECRKTLETCKNLGECRTDEWDHIVEYYYNRDNQKPEGFFNWWE